jgi:DinB family protein
LNIVSTTGLWGQFGAAIDSLERALDACPDDLWGDRSRNPEFWYLVYHTLFWLDLYLSGSSQGFAPPAPYTLGELDPAGVYPDRVYTQGEMRAYLNHGREKCRATLAGLTEARAAEPAGPPQVDLTFGELLIYNLRHVQHHAAQLNLILRQVTDSAPRWVGRTERPLGR